MVAIAFLRRASKAPAEGSRVYLEAEHAIRRHPEQLRRLSNYHKDFLSGQTRRVPHVSFSKLCYLLTSARKNENNEPHFSSRSGHTHSYALLSA